MEFKTAKLDSIATVVSVLVTALLIGLSLFFIFKVSYGWIFAIFMMFIIVICYLLSPKQYSIQEAQLIIEKVIGKKIIIPFEEIEGYVLIPNFMKLRVSRTFGNGGLFGYYGMFSTKEYGAINCQLTSTKNIFILKTKKGNFAISPSKPERFEEYLKSTISGITGEIQTIKPIPEDTINYASGMILIMPIVLFMLVVILVLLNYAQLPDQIAVHFDAYGNADRWGPKSSYLISGLAPSAILLALSIGLFFIVRRTTHDPAIPNFLVIIVSFIQIFIAYTSFDTYWFNKYDIHLIPIIYAIVIFVVIMGILLLFYYQKIIKT